MRQYFINTSYLRISYLRISLNCNIHTNMAEALKTHTHVPHGNPPKSATRGGAMLMRHPCYTASLPRPECPQSEHPGSVPQTWGQTALLLTNHKQFVSCNTVVLLWAGQGAAKRAITCSPISNSWNSTAISPTLRVFLSRMNGHDT